MANLIESPRIFKNPNPRAPLVAVVEFRAPGPVVTTLVIDDGRRRRTVTWFRSSSWIHTRVPSPTISCA